MTGFPGGDRGDCRIVIADGVAGERGDVHLNIGGEDRHLALFGNPLLERDDELQQKRSSLDDGDQDGHLISPVRRHSAWPQC